MPKNNKRKSPYQIPFYPRGEKLYGDWFGCNFCGQEKHKSEIYGFLIDYDPISPICKKCNEQQQNGEQTQC